MRKKLLALIMAGIATFSLISCSGSNTSTSGGNQGANADNGGKKKITVWAWDPNFNIAIMNEAKARYEAENTDVEIEVVDFAKPDLEQKLHTNLAAGNTADLPEIVLIEDYNAQKFLQGYPQAFEDLTGKIPHSDFAKYRLDIMTIDNKTYGVPFDSGVGGLYYRKDIMEEAGVKPEDLVNITWDRFIEIGKTVKEKTGKGLIALDPNDLGVLRMMLQSSGEWYFDESGKPNFVNNETVKEAFTVLKEMFESGIVNLAPGWNAGLKEINGGTVAAAVTGVWYTASITQEASQSGLWAVAPMPKLNDGKSVNATNYGGSSWYVLSGSENKDAAVDFLSTMYTDTDFYQAILENNGAVASYIPSMEGEAYTKEQEFFGGQPIYEDFAKWMQEVPAVNYGMYTYEAEAVIVAEFQEILNGKSIDDALQSIQTQVEMQIQ